jgi:FMN phosphatase YigB (HAD superfamily)
MISAIIFDLDNCLAAAEEIGRESLEPMFAAIRQANHGTLSEDKLEAAFADCWRLPLDVVADKYGFSDEMLAAGWEVGRQITVTAPMSGYPDLEVLKDLAVHLFLVTSGFRALQESKVAALGLQNFTAVYVDAIDGSNRKGKQGIFQEILERHRLEPERVLVVGDNPESEIEAGNRLGMPTVQILRPGVARGTNATYYVHGLSELAGRRAWLRTRRRT